MIMGLRLKIDTIIVHKKFMICNPSEVNSLSNEM